MDIKPFLEGKRIDLRPLRSEDIEGNYVNWLNNADVCEYNSHHVYPYTPEYALQYIRNVEHKKNDCILAIVDKKSGRHIGNVSLQHIDYVSRNAEYAIILGEKEFWGKGIARDASDLILKHGFEALNLHRIYCGTSTENKSMQKLAVALHMREEGVRREAFYKDGKYLSVIEYGILKKEFTAV